MKKLPYAEELNYWKTSQAAPDSWIEKVRKLIEQFGGKVLAEAFGSEPTTGRSAYMLAFALEGDQFKVIWPVLPSQTHNDRAARIQAATMLYHDVKAKLLNVAIFGARNAFFQYLLLPDGRTATQASISELQIGIPTIFSVPQLTNGEMVEGDVK